MLPTGKRVVVIGAGIVGLSCALYAQRRGHHVTVLDPRGFAGGASAGNAGILAVSDCVPIGTPELLRQLPRLLRGRDSPLTLRWSYAPHMVSWFYRFMRACAPSRLGPAMESLAALLGAAKASHYELAGIAGVSAMIRPAGWIKACETDDAFRGMQPDIERMRGHGIECRYMGQDELRMREPNLAPIFRHAIVHPVCDQVIDPAAYVQAYGQAFLAAGGVQIRAEAVAVERKNGVATAVRTHTDRYEADCVVVAAGAWSKSLCAGLDVPVPLDTERGYHVALAADADALAGAPVFWAEKSIVMSPQHGRVRVTSSVEFAGLQGRPDFRKLRALVPDIRRAHRRPLGSVQAEWLGFRPSMPDSLPVIGAAPGTPNALLAFGHGHLGLTMGPVTGALVAELIDGATPRVDLRPFSPMRFRRG
ncbi:MAG TPA: FAD-dependent oxidoreductase [Bordetella sp.]|nr:FAD-dependent oxidoreductase [Bordetella sp.]